MHCAAEQKPAGAPQWSPRRRARYLKAKAFRDRLPDTTPTHVRHCYGNGSRDWWVYTWTRSEGDKPSSARRSPYFCKSWRCEHCAPKERHVLWTRTRDAMQPLDPMGWLFFTLTIPRPEFAGIASVHATFREISAAWRKFKKRLNRWCEAMGFRQTGKEWVGVVEAHVSGWPHLHVALWNPDLADWKRRRFHDQKTEDGRATLLPEPWLSHAVDCGWGMRSTVDVVRSRDAINNYLQKLAADHGKTVGELTKLSQAPTTAPGRFRRLRSGKEFLPPRIKSEDWTGTLMRHRLDQYGNAEAFTLSTLNQSVARQLFEHEENLIQLGEVGAPGLVVLLTRDGRSTPLLTAYEIHEQTSERGPPKNKEHPS